MIIYTYQCLKCNTEFEVEQGLTDNKLTEYNCIHCNIIQPVQRIIVNKTFILNDSEGWAKTGYIKNVDAVGNLL